MYQGVYEDLMADEIPEHLDLYDIDQAQFPLLWEVNDHILTTDLA